MSTNIPPARVRSSDSSSSSPIRRCNRGFRRNSSAQSSSCLSSFLLLPLRAERATCTNEETWYVRGKQADTKVERDRSTYRSLSRLCSILEWLWPLLGFSSGSDGRLIVQGRRKRAARRSGIERGEF